MEQKGGAWCGEGSHLLLADRDHRTVTEYRTAVMARATFRCALVLAFVLVMFDSTLGEEKEPTAVDDFDLHARNFRFDTREEYIAMLVCEALGRRHERRNLTNGAG